MDPTWKYRMDVLSTSIQGPLLYRKFYDNIPTYFFSHNNLGPLVFTTSVDSPSGEELIIPISATFQFFL